MFQYLDCSWRCSLGGLQNNWEIPLICGATQQRGHSEPGECRRGKRKNNTLVSLETCVPGRAVFVAGWVDIPMSSRPGEKLSSFTLMVGELGLELKAMNHHSLPNLLLTLPPAPKEINETNRLKLGVKNTESPHSR